MKRKYTLALFLCLILISSACILSDLMNNEPTPEPEVNNLLATLSVLQTKEAQGENDEEPQPDEQEPEQQPTEAPTQAPQPTPEPDICFENVCFNYSQEITANVWGEIIPEYDPEYEGIERHTPQHLKFNFNNYAVEERYHNPFILVYPVAQLIEFDEYTEWHVNTLQSLIASQPENPVDFPFLPIWNAGALFHSNVDYVDFHNGSGIRYLTEFGQARWPIANTHMFYTFQGITTDGQYYIAAVLPVNHPGVYETGDEVGNDWEGFYDDAVFTTYMDGAVAMLNSQPNDSFTPNLTHLDELFQSMQVE